MMFDEFNKVKLNAFTREVTSRVFMDEKFHVGSAYTIFKIFKDDKTKYSRYPIFTGVLLTKSKDNLKFVTKYYPDPTYHLRRYIPEEAFSYMDGMICVIDLDVETCIGNHLLIEYGGVIYEQTDSQEVEMPT